MGRVDLLIARLRDPFYVDGVEILLSASAGVSLYPAHDCAAQGLIAKAEAALTQAKRRYRGQTHLYDPATAQRALEHARLEQSLRLAIRDRSFACALQPKVDFRSGKVAGLEVLMRWRDENGEPRSPGNSIAFAVNLGLMNEMTQLLFEETLASLDAIDATFGPDLRLGFNIAAQQAGDVRFMRAFTDRLAASGQARRFMIELTEEALLRASQFQLKVAPMLREIGAKISIDDFGVGYSSLSTLAEIEADEIKVDRSFITAIHERPRNQGLLRAIESIGKALNTPVMVEGVETKDELAYLRDHTRIAVAQGYLFSKPVVIGRTTDLGAVGAGRGTMRSSRPRRRAAWRLKRAARPAQPLFFGIVEIGQCARERLRRHGEGLRQRRMRMDGQADVLGVAAHLDRQRRLGDEVAGVGADDAAADQAAARLVPQRLGQALRRDRATASGRSPPRGTPPCRI